MDAGGVTFYRNYPSVSGSAPYAKPLRLTFSQLAGESTAMEDEFADLEKNAAVDAELQRLMSEMNQ